VVTVKQNKNKRIDKEKQRKEEAFASSLGLWHLLLI